MSESVWQERGRFTLRALLWLLFISNVAEQVLSYGTLDRESLFYMAVSLAPTAVVLWAVHRGNWPALVVLGAGTINSIATVSGALAEGRGTNLGDPVLLAATVGMALQMSVLLCVWRSAAVRCWLDARRARRATGDLVLELVLFLLAVALLGAVMLNVSSFFLHTNA